MSVPEETASKPDTETGEAVRLNLGVRLKAAREARGMSEQDVAQRLRLDLRIIRALEADDLERLPALTFVRGYLRNYARLVGLDESMVTEALPDTSAATAGIALKRSASARRTMRTGPRFPLWRWLRNLLLLGLLVVLIVNAYPWVMRQWEAQQQPGSATDTAGTRLRLPGQEMPAEESASLPEGEAALSLPVQDEMPQQPALEELLSPGQVPVETDVAPATPEPAPAPVPVTETAALVLSFDEDSWVEVSDRERRLLFGMVRKGERKLLNGRAPFTLLLGNAPGVTVEYNGTRVDTRSHTSGNVARLKLP